MEQREQVVYLLRFVLFAYSLYLIIAYPNF